MPFIWHGEQVERVIRSQAARNLDAAARFLANKVRHELSVPNQPRKRLKSGRYVGYGPSAPYQPPRKLSGSYRRTIASETDDAMLKSRVGTNDPRGKWFELGTRFMEPRPHLKPTLRKYAAELGRLGAVGL